MKSRFDYRQTVPLQPSWQTRALNALLRLTMRRRIKSDSDVVALRQSYEQIDARYFRVPADVTRTPADCGGVPAERIAVPESREGRVILYLHGGSFAFRFPNAHAALAARLCRRLGARALIPDYRLAPEHPFPAAPDDCHRAYRGLLAEGVASGSLVLVGDSAGGNLALVTIQRARAAGQPTVSTIADEQATNPFLRWGQPAVAAAARTAEPDVAAPGDAVALFAALRRWKDRF